MAQFPYTIGSLSDYKIISNYNSANEEYFAYIQTLIVYNNGYLSLYVHLDHFPLKLLVWAGC